MSAFRFLGSLVKSTGAALAQAVGNVIDSIASTTAGFFENLTQLGDYDDEPRQFPPRRDNRQGRQPRRARAAPPMMIARPAPPPVPVRPVLPPPLPARPVPPPVPARPVIPPPAPVIPEPVVEGITFNQRLRNACLNWSRSRPPPSVIAQREVFVNNMLPGWAPGSNIETLNTLEEILQFEAHLQELIHEILFPLHHLPAEVAADLRYFTSMTVSPAQPENATVPGVPEVRHRRTFVIMSHSVSSLRTDIHAAAINIQVLHTRSAEEGSQVELRRIDVRNLAHSAIISESDNNPLRDWLRDSGRQTADLPLSGFGIYWSGSNLVYQPPVVDGSPKSDSDRLELPILIRRVMTSSIDTFRLADANSIPSTQIRRAAIDLWDGYSLEQFIIPPNTFPYRAYCPVTPSNCGIYALHYSLELRKDPLHKRFPRFTYLLEQWESIGYEQASPANLVDFASRIGTTLTIIDGCQVEVRGARGGYVVDVKEQVIATNAAVGTPAVNWILLACNHYVTLGSMTKFDSLSGQFYTGNKVKARSSITVITPHDSMVKSMEICRALLNAIFRLLNVKRRDQLPLAYEHYWAYLQGRRTVPTAHYFNAVNAKLTEVGRPITSFYLINPLMCSAIAFTQYWGYDLETVVNPVSGDLEVYSVVVFKADWDSQTQSFVGVTTASDIQRLPHLAVLHGDRGRDGVPKDCITLMLEFLEDRAEPHTRNIIVGYNNQRFDNFLSLRTILHRYKRLYNPQEVRGSSNGLVENNNRLMKINWTDNHGHFYELVDTINYLSAGSLRENCKAYKVKDMFMKTSLSHENVQALRDVCTSLDSFIQRVERSDHQFTEGGVNYTLNRSLILEYNKIDVLATMALYHIVTEQLEEITEVKAKDCLTLSQCTWQMFKNSTAEVSSSGVTEYKWEFHLDDRFKEQEQDRQPYDVWSFFRQALYGGRAQIFQRGVHSTDFQLGTFSNIRVFDVCSLYAFVQLACDYPNGPAHPVVSYNPGDMGIYRVLVVRQPKVKIVPYRKPDAPLDWNYDRPFLAVLTSVDIKCIRDHDGVVLTGGEFLPFDAPADTPHVEGRFQGQGYWWPQPISGQSLFGCLQKLKDIKMEEDRFKQEDEANKNVPGYIRKANPARRATVKTGSCSIYGRTEMKPVTKDSCIIGPHDREKAVKFIETHEDSTINFFGMSVNDSFLITGDRDIADKKLSPMHLGAFILAYARAHMYYSGVYQAGAILTDTDSAVLNLATPEAQALIRRGLDHTGITNLRSRFGRFHISDQGMEKEYGDFEMEEYNITTCVAIRPKVYALYAAILNPDEVQAFWLQHQDRLTAEYPEQVRNPDSRAALLTNLLGGENHKIRFKGLQRADRYFDLGLIPELIKQLDDQPSTQIHARYLSAFHSSYAGEFQELISIPEPNPKQQDKIRVILSKFNQLPDKVKRDYYHMNGQKIAMKDRQALERLANYGCLPVISASLKRNFHSGACEPVEGQGFIPGTLDPGVSSQVSAKLISP